MAEHDLRGTPASPGEAIGTAWRRTDLPDVGHGAALVAPEARQHELTRALSALSAAGEALKALASRLPADEAEIVEAGVLMTLDPALRRGIEDAVISEGLPAAAAILRETSEQADAIANLGDVTLAARADDVRSIGRRAVSLVCGSATHEPSGRDPILVAHDLGPADVAELAHLLAGVVLVGGGPTAHAAIVARSLGIPMVTGVDPRILEVTDGTAVALDGKRGIVVVEPSPQRSSLAAERMHSSRLDAEIAEAEQDQPAVTSDGRRITVLANVASVAELKLAFGYGAEGIGLLRTELAFLDADRWPDEREHTEALRPILDGLRQQRAIVRVLDFGADKSPPFLNETTARGLELLLAHPEAFIRQLRAILICARGHAVQVLLPMVDEPGQLVQARALLEHAARGVGMATTPALGSMVETPVAAANAYAIAKHSDFLSIGTNDLTATTLDADRFSANQARALDPRVLRLIARSVDAAHEAQIPIEVCGEAASDPLMLPLLVGLGVDELSAGAAQVGAVRRWIRRMSAADADSLARSAVRMESADEVERAVTPLAAKLQSAEPGALVQALGA